MNNCVTIKTYMGIFDFYSYKKKEKTIITEHFS